MRTEKKKHQHKHAYQSELAVLETLIKRNEPIVSSTLWSSLPGGFKSHVRLLCDRCMPARTRRKVRDLVYLASHHEEEFVVWTPPPDPNWREPTLPRGLGWGYTVTLFGRCLVSFQLIGFIPKRSKKVLRTPAGDFSVVSIHFLTCWDGTPLDAPRQPPQ